MELGCKGEYLPCLYIILWGFIVKYIYIYIHTYIIYIYIYNIYIYECIFYDGNILDDRLGYQDILYYLIL